MCESNISRSSSELPSDPPTTPSGANDDNHGTPTDLGCAGSGANLENFLNNHLLRAPLNALHHLTQANIHAKLASIKKADTIKRPIYALLASLLTTMSKALYKALHKHEKTALRKRHRVPPGKPGHLTFVDHHTTAPTQFPHQARGAKVDDKPALLGVYNVADFEPDPNPIPILDHQCHQVYKGIPYHRIEAIVEIVPLDGGCGGREKLVTYACHHHQARPDRPGVYGLVAKPEWYQVIYSDPSGVVASPETSWDNLELLAAYVYSHYCPPPGHFLWDDTIQWAVGTTISDMPTWKVKVQTQWYTNGALVFLGDPQRRRTTILRANGEDGQQVIIKEMYRQDCLFKEENILEHIHHDGEVLGAVRMQGWEEVENGGEVIQCIRENKKQTKVRFALRDSGVSLFQARSVNDLLKAIYDALEVHRTMYNKCTVLQRDMSFSNILMYPKWGHSNRPVSEKLPVFIEGFLRGSKPTEPGFPTCLVIDFDHAADLNAAGCDRVLRERTGTPLFIARSVSLGTTLQANDTFTGAQMPLLQGDALDLYLALHGDIRYNLYNDQPMTDGQRGTFHGGLPPTTAPAELDTELLPAFSHRPEHDVESIYWTMVYTLLYASPDGIATESKVSTDSRVVWDILLSHHIPEERNPRLERRGEILGSSKKQWKALFCDKMADVAVLLYEISRHVCSEYAMWTWTARHQQDHLHEAVQRLIFQYLVEHQEEGQDIPLKPNAQRPTRKGFFSPLERARAAQFNDPAEFLPAKSVVGLKRDIQRGGTSTVPPISATSAPATGSQLQKQPTATGRTCLKRQSGEYDLSSDEVRTSKRRKISSDKVSIGNAGAMDAANVITSRAGRDQPSIPLCTDSKRKSEDLGKPLSEGLRRTKRRKATVNIDDGGDVGRSGVPLESRNACRRSGRGMKGGRGAKGASGRKDISGGGAGGAQRAGANGRSGVPSARAAKSLVPSPATRSKRRTADSDESSEGVRSSQRLKDAAAKKELEAAKKVAERNGGGKKSATKRLEIRRT